MIQVLTETRQFQSKSGRPVPQFLPNFGSEWYKTYKRVENDINSRMRINLDAYKEEVEDIIKNCQYIDSDEIVVEGSEEGCLDSSANSNQLHDLLGLSAFKTPNNTQQIFNILCKHPTNPITIADFDDTVRAQLPYVYATHIKKDKSRTADDLAEIEAWEKTLPVRPSDNKNGFKKGAAQAWFKENHAGILPVLERIIQKRNDPTLRRAAKSEYDQTRMLQPDQVILDSLPEQPFFTKVFNSENAGNTIIYKYLTFIPLLCPFVYLCIRSSA